METDKKKENEEIPDVERQGWDAEKLANESIYKESDEIVREMLRGDETKGKPDQRDIVGATDTKDTNYGRRETKKIDNEENS